MSSSTESSEELYYDYNYFEIFTSGWMKIWDYLHSGPQFTVFIFGNDTYNHTDYHNRPSPETWLPVYHEFILVVNFIKRYLMNETVEIIVKAFFDNYSALSIVTVTIFGAFGNAINVFVFHRQGIFKDSCTMVLFFLSLTDFAVCSLQSILIIAGNVLGSGFMHDSGNVGSLSTDAEKKILGHILGFAGHRCLNKFSYWITMYLTIERMICVTFPFKVKVLLSPKRSLFIIIGLFLVSLVGFLPYYINTKMELVESERENGTKVKNLVYTGVSVIPRFITSSMVMADNVILPIFQVIVVIISNIIIAMKVNISKKFRNTKSTAHGKAANMRKISDGDRGTASATRQSKAPSDSKARRELRLNRVLYAVSLTFLICQIPHILSLICVEFPIQSFRFWGIKALNFTATFRSTLLYIRDYLANLNSATNIFIYYTLSKRYRNILSPMLFFCSKTNN